VDQGVAVGVGTARGEAEAGRERMKRTKRGSTSVGRSPYSRMRRWPRWRKWWAVRWRPRFGHGWHGWRRGSDWPADGWAPVVLIFPQNI
jgi:hypothetical protein